MSATSIQLKSKTSIAIGDLLRMARAGKLHGFAYAVVKEDDDGTLSAGSNVLWNGDPIIKQALDEAVETLKKRMDEASPKSKFILPN